MPKNIRIFYFNIMDIYIYITVNQALARHVLIIILLEFYYMVVSNIKQTYYKERSKQFVFAMIKFAIASKAMRCIFDI